MRGRAGTHDLLGAAVLLGIACTPVADSAPAQALVEAVAGEGSHEISVIAEGLAHPWGLAFLSGDEGILITERPGRLRIVREGRLAADPVQGVPPVRSEGESGLFDVLLDPDFERNRLVYLSYAKTGSPGRTSAQSTTAVGRGRFVEGRLQGFEEIFVADAWGVAAVNHGGRLAFDADGGLLVTVGDRREEPRALNADEHVGTTVRLLLSTGASSGSSSGSNPAVEVVSYGHRNVLGLALDAATGELWMTENGPAGGDELNRLREGANYGWPAVSFGNHYDGRPIPAHATGDGYEPPVHFWVPGISPSGLAVYRANAFPEWKGDLFVGSLQRRDLRRLRVRGGQVVEEERLLHDLGHRIRAVAVGPDGYLYLLADAASAPLLRIEPRQ